LLRLVGEELGGGAGSLYWHVRNKEELLQLIFERVTEEMELPEPDPACWQEQLGDPARAMRANLKRHRDVARISFGRVQVGRTLAVYTEWPFTLLKPVGIPDRVIAYLGDFFGLSVAAYTFEESLGMSSPTGEEMAPEQIVAMLRDYALTLPEERFPNTRAALDLIFSGGDERYEFGIELLLRGLASYASDSPPAAAPPKASGRRRQLSFAARAGARGLGLAPSNEGGRSISRPNNPATALR
jgi:TetR/AcrR family transcriptional regulator, tetracycline repressor protein